MMDQFVVGADEAKSQNPANKVIARKFLQRYHSSCSEETSDNCLARDQLSRFRTDSKQNSSKSCKQITCLQMCKLTTQTVLVRWGFYSI